MENIARKIDRYIKTKYFKGQEIKRVTFKKTTKDNYFVIYQQEDGQQIRFQVAVTTKNNETMFK